MVITMPAESIVTAAAPAAFADRTAKKEVSAAAPAVPAKKAAAAPANKPAARKVSLAGDPVHLERTNPDAKDIVVMHANAVGHDFVIGDIHGAKGALDAALQKLGPDDRLFIVGDLMDRGEDSMGVMQTVMNDRRIHVVRGNHEESFLQALKVINSLLNDKPETLNDIESFYNFLIFLNNGGDAWIFKPEKTVSILSIPKRQKGEESLDYKKRIRALFLEKLKKQELEFQPIEALEAMRVYIDALPYIRVVGDIANRATASSTQTKPFLVCHASMPMDDKKLIDKIERGDYTLNPNDKAYITWARPPRKEPREEDITIKDVGRTLNSTLCFFGHTPIVYPSQSGNPVTNDNGLNLDFAAFLYGMLPMVDVTAGIVIPCETENTTVPTVNNLIDYSILENGIRAIENHIRKDRGLPQQAVNQPIELQQKRYCNDKTNQVNVSIGEYAEAVSLTQKKIADAEKKPKKGSLNKQQYNATLKSEKSTLNFLNKRLVYAQEFAIKKQKGIITRFAPKEPTYHFTPHEIKSKKEMVFYPKPAPASKLTNFARGKAFDSSAHIAFGEFFYEKLALDESKTRNFSLNEVFQAAYPDFEYAKATQDRSTKDLMKELLNRRYDVFKLECAAFRGEPSKENQNSKTISLEILKAKLKYRKAIYQMRKNNDQQYKGIGFFQSAHKSVDYKLKAVEQMLNEVDAALAPNLPMRAQSDRQSTRDASTSAITNEDKKIAFARQDGQLGVLNKLLKAAVKQNQIPAAVAVDGTRTGSSGNPLETAVEQNQIPAAVANAEGTDYSRSSSPSLS